MFLAWFKNLNNNRETLISRQSWVFKPGIYEVSVHLSIYLSFNLLSIYLYISYYSAIYLWKNINVKPLVQFANVWVY